MSCCLKRRCVVILVLSFTLLLPSAAVWAAPRDVGDVEVRQSRWVQVIEEVVDWVQSMWGAVDPGPGLDPFLVVDAEPSGPDNVQGDQEQGGR